eukprot:TRINITY_DN68088_c5_g8_i1.p1 TRINITY_DN68088_c5_g8~~TRINITY_DN68088_c5_g8_i1.p1  ORF type:complete len:245 (-),score=35.04 TRINITY_DN68088_c5_g8_i1:266-1000(-)
MFRQGFDNNMGKNSMEEFQLQSWGVLHGFASTFSDNPTPQEQMGMQQFLQLFAQFYPCADCGNHMNAAIRNNPPDTTSRSALMSWICELHNAVNRKLGKPVHDCGNFQALQGRWSPYRRMPGGPPPDSRFYGPGAPPPPPASPPRDDFGSSGASYGPPPGGPMGSPHSSPGPHSPGPNFGWNGPGPGPHGGHQYYSPQRRRPGGYMNHNMGSPGGSMFNDSGEQFFKPLFSYGPDGRAQRMPSY